MKQSIAILMFATVVFSSCDKESIHGSGAVITQERTVPAFTGVQVNGDGDATITYGIVQRVSVTGYENLVPVYETKLVGNILHLQFKPNQYRIRNNNIRVDIVVPAIAGAHLNGSGSLSVKDFINGDEMHASINGSGSVNINDNKYNKVKYEIHGSGKITGNTTTATTATAEIFGSGHIKLNVTNRLDASISGSGVIEYWGNPATANTHVSGSGNINKK